MQGKDTTKSTLNQLVGQLTNTELINFLKAKLGVDRYVLHSRLLITRDRE